MKKKFYVKGTRTDRWFTDIVLKLESCIDAFPCFVMESCTAVLLPP